VSEVSSESDEFDDDDEQGTLSADNLVELGGSRSPVDGGFSVSPEPKLRTKSACDSPRPLFFAGTSFSNETESVSAPDQSSSSLVDETSSLVSSSVHEVEFLQQMFQSCF